MVLQAILDAQGEPQNYVEDFRIAQSTRIALNDVRHWLETLAFEGYVEVARTEVGLSASITALGRLLAAALEAARAIEDEGPRAHALGALAPHLTPPLLAAALEAARAIEDEGPRAHALGALVPHLPPGEREPVLRQALEAARALWDEGSRAERWGRWRRT